MAKNANALAEGHFRLFCPESTPLYCQIEASRPRNQRVPFFQNTQDLLGAPLGVLPPEREKRLGYLDGGFVRAALRASGAFLQAGEPLGLESGDPFVPCGPANPIAAAEFGHAEGASYIILDEQSFLVHG